MKLYILEGSFVNERPNPETFKPALAAHHAYLQTWFDNGNILFSGPKVGTGGGVIVIKCDDIEKFCAEDPFVTSGIQTYKIIEFKNFACQEEVKSWFE